MLVLIACVVTCILFLTRVAGGLVMPIQKVISKGKVPVKIYTDEVEYSAMEQLYNLSQLPIIHSHIAAMPDVHMGKGATVGSVIPTKGATPRNAGLGTRPTAPHTAP